MNRDTLLLMHILDETEFIISNTKGLSFAEFLSDTVLKKAVVQSFGVIGEAADLISPEFRSSHSEINWKGMTGFRNRLIHKYFDINFSQVWEIIESDIPVLNSQISKLL